MMILRQWIERRGRWSRLILAILLGAMSGLVFQPLSLVPLLAIALIGLLWLVHGATSPRHAAFLGWAFGTSHFLVGLYWISNAFMVHAARHAVLAIPAVGGMASVLGLYIAGVVWIYRKLVPGSSITIANVFIFSALWVGMEWVRSWAFTGFPWNLVGNIWSVSDAMLQTAAIGGVYLLSLITVLVFSLPAILGFSQEEQSKEQYIAVLFGMAVLGLMYGGGQYRLAQATNDSVPDVRLRLVQPNIPQNLKWDPSLRSSHVAAQLRSSLHRDTKREAPTHVIWAETAVPYVLSSDPNLVSLLSKAAPENGVLIAGSLRRGPASLDGGKPSTWNSLFAIGDQGKVLATYDKSHLVPFGEYVPFQELLPIAKLTAGAASFSAGVGPQRLVLNGLPAVSPLICYEIIFPGQVIAREQPRPAWILNLTNDAWYGISAGPYQHFAMARMRAVEEGLPVVRVANTGISGVIDGYGRVTTMLGLGQEGVLDSDLPEALTPTLFAQWGNTLSLVFALIVFCAGILKQRYSAYN